MSRLLPTALLVRRGHSATAALVATLAERLRRATCRQPIRCGGCCSEFQQEMRPAAPYKYRARSGKGSDGHR